MSNACQIVTNLTIPTLAPYGISANVTVIIPEIGLPQVTRNDCRVTFQAYNSVTLVSTPTVIYETLPYTNQFLPPGTYNFLIGTNDSNVPFDNVTVTLTNQQGGQIALPNNTCSNFKNPLNVFAITDCTDTTTSGVIVNTSGSVSYLIGAIDSNNGFVMADSVDVDGVDAPNGAYTQNGDVGYFTIQNNGIGATLFTSGGESFYANCPSRSSFNVNSGKAIRRAQFGIAIGIVAFIIVAIIARWLRLTWTF